MNITLEQMTQPAVFGVIAVICALYFFVRSFVMVQKARKRDREFEHVTGTVASVEVRERVRNVECIPTVTYSIGDQGYSGIPKGRIPNAVYRFGDELGLCYPKDKPTDIYVSDPKGFSRASSTSIGVGIVCLILAVVLFVKQAHR